MPDSALSPTTANSSWPKALVFSLLLPVIAALIVYQLDSFDPAPFPPHELPSGPLLAAPLRNDRMLHGSEVVGLSELPGPEDIIFDEESNVMYTGCADGWVKRVRIGESVDDMVIENWVNTGGRPLGLAFGRHKDIVVGDADKGLLSISSQGKVTVLSKVAEGVEAKLTDGVDIAQDGKIYFTDASSKYPLKHYIRDVLEGKPHGRFLVYDPETDQTTVLLRGLYFPNGVSVSPDQSFVVYCETPMQRCRKYNIQGEKKGTVEPFAESMPGFPDNIKYDGKGHFWISIASAPMKAWEIAFKYPIVRKMMGIVERYFGMPRMEENGGAFVVDVQGKPIAHYHDTDLSMVSSAVRIGDHVYCGSIAAPYMIRLNLTQYPAK